MTMKTIHGKTIVKTDRSERVFSNLHDAWLYAFLMYDFQNFFKKF